MQVRTIMARILGFLLNVSSWVNRRFASKKAFSLFTSPPRPKIRPKEQAFLDTAELQQNLRRYGKEMVEYHWGLPNDPIIILSYGWAYNSGRWRHFVPALVEAGYRVIAYDPPGHGHAKAGQVTLPDNAALIRAIIQAYGRPTAIVGHSFGGASAVLALSELPEQLHPTRMVVMASFSDARTVFRSFKRMLGLAYRTYCGFLRELENRVGESVQAFDLARRSAAFATVQALLVHDKEDAVTPYGQSLRYHLFWPSSYLFTSNGKGHHLGSNEITQAILQFLIKAEIPSKAEVQPHKLAADHDLVRYFAGWEA